ncbi:hypothetical protein K439DRAFT_1647130 [Ramaria rubella]|nr:hypothetical protein K439DRAFT_1647130 [Ramaria rubella]
MHLILHNLDDFDILYLQALLNNDWPMIQRYEEAAWIEGYGPLAACMTVAAPREQKGLCHEIIDIILAIWHQNSNGVLTQGSMDHTTPCPAMFKFYYPYDIDHCPSILLISVLDVFNQLLEGLGWKLADATPHQIILDLGFVNSLRKALGWRDPCDPTLGNLHPSLSNTDHTARYINKLRHDCYPLGTGLEGAYHILDEHTQLPPEKQYVCCVEEHSITGEGKIYIVICMFKAMSKLLLETKRPSIDMSFKWLHKWQEFEIEAWFPEYHCSRNQLLTNQQFLAIVVACTFTTSQSADAHPILFNCIFAIVCEDTGHTVWFCHIHGDGFDTFVADGHVGQVLGLGRCCEGICRNMAGYCTIEWTRALHTLTPYKHLARMYCYCFAHFIRNVNGLKGHVSLGVWSAMGGKKTADGLKNKESASGFAIAALYQPASKIPIEIWKASPSTSNGNEQAHRNINRDGIKLMMLAGIMWGMQYDSHAMSGLELLCTYSISSRDQQQNHFRHGSRAIVQSSAVQKCTMQACNVEWRAAYKQLVGLQPKPLKHALEKDKGVERASKTLCILC